MAHFVPAENDLGTLARNVSLSRKQLRVDEFGRRRCKTLLSNSLGPCEIVALKWARSFACAANYRDILHLLRTNARFSEALGFYIRLGSITKSKLKVTWRSLLPLHVPHAWRIALGV